MNENGDCYVSYNFETVSQMMRILIAKDLKIESKFDWRKNTFIKNVELMMEKLKKMD